MPLPFLSSRASRARSSEPAQAASGDDAQNSSSSKFTMPALPAIPGARPRHRLQLPAEPTETANTVKEPDQQVSHLPSKQSQVPEHGRHLTNPIYFGFMLAVGITLALICIYFVLNVGALAGWITGAVFIGLGLDPAVRKLEQRGLPRGAGVGVVFLAFASIVGALTFWIIPMVARQAVSFITGFPNQVEAFLNSDLFTSLDEKFQIRSAVDGEVEKVFTQLTSDTSVVSNFMNSLLNAGSTLAETTTGIIIVLFLSIYVLASLPTIKAWFIRLAPASRRERVGYLTEKISDSVGHYVMGQALVAICNATVAALIMLIVGVPFAQLLMLLVLVLAFIPLIGGVSAAVLVSLISLTDSWQTALFFLVPYLIYLQIEAYFISPRIMKKAVAVPGAVAIIAVVAGGSIWGVLGAIIAIPVAASILILVNEVLVPRQDRL
ncbi:AI-2E family transporter [Rothia sp. CCM 9416]|uniref:AI-2E family transporter n=1 Tax=Rothia sp. CCM 9416 TaxID=3402655 RepID=UPI003ADE2C8D